MGAFSDGVITIITIMVLELKVPHGLDFHALLPLGPVFMNYALSFIYVGICRDKLQNGNYPVAGVRLYIVEWKTFRQLLP